MPAHNVLLILSDEHTREALGCYGYAYAHTPNLDRLARRGTRFTNAYTTSPVCVPARASIATGRYVHDIGCWSNAQPYDGSVTSWGHRLIDQGHKVVAVGKLHYRSIEDSNGFDPEIIPLHVRDGIGWVRGLIGREAGATWDGTVQFAEEIGPGWCDYNRYDLEVCDEACDWLRLEAPRHTAKPWVLYASFVSPHYPLIVPQEYYDLYDPDALPPLRMSGTDGTDHPVVQGIRRFFNYDDHFDQHSRRVARASYFGLCSFMDAQVGRLLEALEDSGQLDNTLVIYTSDHGELAGNRGLWTKMVMYEESAGIPMIVAGPGAAGQAVIDAPVSLIDIYPTVVQSAGLELTEAERALPGRSLLTTAQGFDGDRSLLSEYHDGGAITGMFMIRKNQWKFVYYPGYPPQLFDIENDPQESIDLGQVTGYEKICAELEGLLREITDPDIANEAAFASQATLIDELGGREGVLDIGDFDHSPVPI